MDSFPLLITDTLQCLAPFSQLFKHSTVENEFVVSEIGELFNKWFVPRTKGSTRNSYIKR
jgi:hypothetical protein